MYDTRERGNRRLQAGLFIVTAFVLGSCAIGVAQEFAGGTGAPNDPYLIATAEQLIGMGQAQALRDKHFALVADLDLDPCLPGRTVFEEAVVAWEFHGSGRAGGTIGGLKGSFDGRGHAIRNCVISRVNNSTPIGVFDRIDYQGRVSNLRVENAWISDFRPSGSQSRPSYGGIIAGENAGTVINCSTSGTIFADAVEPSASAGRGGLIGYNIGTISQCYTQAYISGVEVGGIVGINGGTVHHCSASAYVVGDSAGGLIGLNDTTGRVVFCSADGYTVGHGNAGGLVGANSGMAQFCFAQGYAFGGDAGGLIGDNSGTVRESYASAWASGSYGGGLVGHNDSEVVNCYANGPFDRNLTEYYGALIGFNEGAILSSYCATTLDEDKTAVPPIYRMGGSIARTYFLSSDKPWDSGGSSLPIVPLLPEEMEDRASFVGFDFYGDANDGDADHWFMPENGYPVLTWQTEITGLIGVPDIAGFDVNVAANVLEQAGFVLDFLDYDYDISIPACNEQSCLASRVRSSGYAPPGSIVQIVASLGPYDFSDNPGDGSQANPFQIETASQLDSLRDQPEYWGSHFVLTADINMSRRVYSRPLVERFSGTFDGNGHTVQRFQIDAPLAPNYLGLFGIIEPGGVVAGLTLIETRIQTDTYSTYVGMLAGENLGRIDGCEVSGEIRGANDAVGGLVGLNHGHILNSSVSGRIEGNGSIGGLVGRNSLSIAACRVTAVSVLGKNFVGGLAGFNTGPDSFIEDCYTQGSVQGNARVAGLAAGNASFGGRSGSILLDPGRVRNCYTTCSVAGGVEVAGLIAISAPDSIQESCFFLDPNDGGGPDNGLGTVLSEPQMKQQASFANWDFVDVWTICEGADYPRLRWEDVSCEP